MIILGSLFLVACGFFFPFDRSPRGMGPNFGNWRTGFESNGERVYFTATNERGEYIQYTGGATFTHALQSGSPAIDQGDNNGCPNTDQRRYSRPADGDGDGSAVCDIGAYEFDGVPPVVTATATATEGVPPTNTPTPTSTFTPPPGVTDTPTNTPIGATPTPTPIPTPPCSSAALLLVLLFLMLKCFH